jgi:hypothetical protein
MTQKINKRPKNINKKKQKQYFNITLINQYFNITLQIPSSFAHKSYQDPKTLIKIKTCISSPHSKTFLYSEVTSPTCLYLMSTIPQNRIGKQKLVNHASSK